jgi:aminoglycoside phosphotransferase (APT) family kinase protein
VPPNPLEAHLPPDLAGPATTITPIAAGLSGAGVYRVEAAGQPFVLKVAAESEGAADWHRTLHFQRLAAAAGLAPRIVHVDEPGRAVLSVLVVDRSFRAFYLDPRTREAALAQLGATVRRIQALPLPADAPRRDPREILAHVWNDLLPGFAIPGFAADAIQRALADDPPAPERPLVLGHNDLNPTNFVFDGEAILVLDWATAGPADAFYDLAVLALFLRMDEATCLRLLSACEGAPVGELPYAFVHSRRLAAAFCGAYQLHIARGMKHPGATGAETLDAALSLGDFYQRLRSGALQIATAEGLWTFGLALLKESLAG